MRKATMRQQLGLLSFLLMGAHGCAPDGIATETHDEADAAAPGLDEKSRCEGRCSKDCRCEVGEGDCDRSEDCASGLVCPPDVAGKTEYCSKPQTSCEGRCDSSCKCRLGEGDCDRNEDCASGLVCPADVAGKTEYCSKPSAPNPGGNPGPVPGGGSGGPGGGSGNLKVKSGGSWYGIHCDGSTPRAVGGEGDSWRIVGDRRLQNSRGEWLVCSEGWNTERDCICTRDSGLTDGIHAVTQADWNVYMRSEKDLSGGNHLTESNAKRGPMRYYPNSGHEFCMVVRSGKIAIKKSYGGGDHSESSHSMCDAWCYGDGCR